MRKIESWEGDDQWFSEGGAPYEAHHRQRKKQCYKTIGCIHRKEDLESHRKKLNTGVTREQSVFIPQTWNQGAKEKRLQCDDKLYLHF